MGMIAARQILNRAQAVLRPSFPRLTPFRAMSAQTAAAEEPISVTVEVPVAEDDPGLKPNEVVDQLDRYIVGQGDAKRAVAIALRNRWRRHRLPDDLKVEVTKVTEVGFHGRDVDQIIRDLVDISINLTKKLRTEKMRDEVEQIVEDRILATLIGAHAREDSGGKKTEKRKMPV